MASTTGSEIALADYTSNGGAQIESRATGEQVEDHGLEFSLPTVDGGKDAWLFLAGSFFVEALLWGEHHSPTFS